jgi:hypothetical protein
MLLSAHALSTWFMVGLIWFVQIVHYPLFAAVPEPDRIAYARQHARRTTWVVAPVMSVEALASLWLAAQPPPHLAGSWLPLAGAALTVVVWLSTALVQVPLHDRLGAGGGREVVEWLVRTNWLRTLAWTGRGAIAASMLA